MAGTGHHKKVLFRCDGSPSIGGGHLFRCLTLAKALKKQGVRVCFACTAETFSTFPDLIPKHFDTVVLDCESDEEIKLLAKTKTIWDAVVVDHYQKDRAYEASLRSLARMVMAIDDLPNRKHDCDVLFDQTYGRSEQDYTELVKPGCNLLLGSRYALLRNTFAELRKGAVTRRTNQQTVSRVLVSCGATDNANMTASLLKWLIIKALPIHYDVVLTSGAPHLAEVSSLVNQLDEVSSAKLRVDEKNMAQLMVDSDIAFGAAGSSAWERCALGLPTLMMVVADNQRQIAEGLAEQGAAVLIAIPGSLENGHLESVFFALCESKERRDTITECALRLCDGRGADKVASTLLNQMSALKDI